MGDPELRSDEKILLRTPGVSVKSIPFEGILTNKRIILVDRATNLLPQKEIPLVTIRDIEAGENAIRDQIITLSVLLRSGEKRQIILTFSRQTGGNRIKERDAWLKTLKEHTSSSFEQVIRKVLPGQDKPPKKSGTSASPRIRVIGSPTVRNAPAAEKIPGMKEQEEVAPVKKIIELPPSPASPEPEKTAPDSASPRFGTYCSRCGNRVPDGSGYCNRCGSKIVVPDTITAFPIPPAAKPPLPKEEDTADIRATPPETGSAEPFIKPLKEKIPSAPRTAFRRESEAPAEREPASPVSETFPIAEEDLSEGNDAIHETERPVIIDSSYPEPVPPLGKPPAPKRPWDGFSIRPGKKALIGIVVIIIVLAVILGGFFLYPMITGSSDSPSDGGAFVTTLPTTVKNPGTAVPTKTLAPVVKTTRTIVPGNRPANVGF